VSQLSVPHPKNLRTVSALPLVFIFSVEAIWLCYRITSYAATALGPVALERALEGTRLFMAFVFGAVLSRLLPQIFGPERKSVTVVNVALAVILIIGIYLVP
jgi:hypothetical protein